MQNKSFLVCIIVVLFSSLTYAGTTKTVIDHAGHTVEIPTNPKRIASLHTMSTTFMLWDLGAPIIGTATRIKADENNRPYIRSVEEVFNVRFEETNLVSYGKFGQDIEQIKKSKPDLIIGTLNNRDDYNKLSEIAPTVLISHKSHEIYNVFKDVAYWVGKGDLFEEKNNLLKKRISEIKSKFSVPPETQTIAYADPYAGQAKYNARLQYGAFMHVAYSLGFQMSPFLVNQFGKDSIGGKLTAETFSQLDTDWLLSTFRNQTGETIETIYEGFDDIAPGWRLYNKAYRNKQFVALEREKVYPMAFISLNWVLDEFEKFAK